MNYFIEILKTLIECSTVLFSVGLICMTIKPAFEDKKGRRD